MQISRLFLTANQQPKYKIKVCTYSIYKFLANIGKMLRVQTLKWLADKISVEAFEVVGEGDIPQCSTMPILRQKLCIAS